MSDIKQTALHQWHVDLGAKMVPFAGYDMPVQYPLGVLNEHLHTRAKAGLFDVSHMGQIQVFGEDAAVILESVFPADLQNLAIGKQAYSLLLNADGGVVDDLMICRREMDFILVVNAGCKDNDFAYLQTLIGDKLTLTLLDDRSLLALQGPLAATVLASLGADVRNMVFMDGAWLEVDGIECWATRSGYTGEDGFELSVSSDKAQMLAEVLMEHADVEAIGLGARDSLRLEAGLCLYGHELDESVTPIEASLLWAINKNRRAGGDREGGFIGADRILQQVGEGTNKKRIALLAEGRAPIREGCVLFDEEDNEVGVVTSGGFAPSLGKPVLMGYVDVGSATVGTKLFAAVRKKKLPVIVSRTPFVPNNYFRG